MLQKQQTALETQIQAMKSCREFLSFHVPSWRVDALNPAEGLQTGVANCAARMAIAITYLDHFGLQADFAFQVYHGHLDREGEARMGHALALAPRVMSFMRLGIDSDDYGNVKTYLMGERKLKNYHVRSLEDGYPEYCNRVEKEISLKGLSEAVAVRI